MILNYNIKKIITEIYKKKKFFSKNNSSFRTLMYHSIVKDSFNSKENMWDLSESTFNEDIYGSSAPVNSRVLGRIANSYIEVVDYIGSDEIKIPVYPTYDATTKTLIWFT